MKKYNIVISILLVCITGAVFYGTKDIEMIGLESIGSGFWPRVLGCILAILSIILLIQTIIKKNINKENPIDFKNPGMKRVLGMCVILLAFSFVLKLFGFFIAALLLIPACMFILGEKRVVYLLGVTIGLELMIYIIFPIILNVSLPTGIIFG